MKLTKKKVVISALSVSLAAILSAGSLAWFTAQDEVTNKFMFTNSDATDADEIFSVDVWENTPGGVVGDDSGAGGYTYDDILPGDVLTKEVYVENTGYYDQYIRVTVTVSDAAAWQAALNTTKVPKLEQIVEGYDPNANVWVDADSAIVGDDIVYTLHYRNILLGEQESIYDNGGVHQSQVMVFSAVKIPASLTVAQAAAFANGFEIKVFAEAVQTENLGLDRTKGDGAEEAFAFIEGNS